MKLLVTQRLFLEPLEERDTEYILALRSDPLVNKFLERTPIQTMKEAFSFVEKITNGYASGDCFYWAIRNEKNGPLIGTVCLWNFSEDRSSAELGYEMLPAFQGNGYMNETVREVIEFAFKELHLKKLEAYTHKENAASMRLLVSNNFAGPFEPPPDYTFNDFIFILEQTV